MLTMKIITGFIFKINSNNQNIKIDLTKFLF